MATLLALVGEVPKNFPLVEAVIFVALGAITLFRKRLSSNYEYTRPRPTRASHMPSFLSLLLQAGRYVLSLGSSRFSQSYSGGRRGESLKKSLVNDLDVSTPSSSSSSQSDLICNTLQQRDVLLNIIYYLAITDVGSLMGVSRALYVDSRSDQIWENLWKVDYGTMWDELSHVRLRRNIVWSPLDNWGPPAQGWFIFYIEFEACWMEWMLAGFSSTEMCLVKLFDSIYDVTPFLSEHPGGAETLAMNCGCDSSGMFTDVCHSTTACDIAESLLLWSPPKCGTFQSKIKRLKNKSDDTWPGSGQGGGSSSAGANLEIEMQRCIKGQESRAKSGRDERVLLQWGFGSSRRTKFALELQLEKERLLSSLRSGGAEGSKSSLVHFLSSFVSSSDLHDGGSGNGNVNSNGSNVNNVNNVDSVSKGKLSVLSKITDLNGYLDCEAHFQGRAAHFCGPSEARVFYDPLEQAWWVWYPCCGRGCKVHESFYKG